MNRSDIVDQVAEVTDTKKTARQAVDRTVDTIIRALAEGERVQISGLGVFTPEQVPSRFVRNPATGKKVRAKKTARVKFRPATSLREYIVGRKKLPKQTRTQASTKAPATTSAPARKTSKAASGSRKKAASSTTRKRAASK